MKKYIFLACALALATGFTSCSTDPEDATHKHVYSDSENVYLNTSAGKNHTETIEFNVGSKDVYSIDLTQYNADFQSELGVSAADLANAVNSGAVDMYLIRLNKAQWIKDAKNCNTGWYIGTNNISCDQDKAVAKTWLDGTKLNVQLMDNTPLGTGLDFCVGFGKKSEYGTYDKYVRLEQIVSVSDMSVIMATFDMAEGDYAGYEMFFMDTYDKQFLACMGLTAQEALNGLANGTVGFYLTDADGKITGKDYTADAGDGYYGYWLDWNAQNYGWKSGASVYVDAELNERGLYFGRYPEVSSYQGKQLKVNLIMVLLSDTSKYIRFIITLNM